MSDKVQHVLMQLEYAQRTVPEAHVVCGMARTCIESSRLQNALRPTIGEKDEGRL